PEASINIVMARTLDASGTDLGATMFFVDMDAPGFRVDRILDTIDTNSPGGHAEVSFNAVHVRAIAYWVGSAKDFAPRRCGSGRLACPIACAGSARRADVTPSPPNTPGGATRLAARSANIRESASCWPTMKLICICRA